LHARRLEQHGAPGSAERGDPGDFAGHRLAQQAVGLEDLVSAAISAAACPLLLQLEENLSTVAPASEDVVGLDLGQVEDRHQPVRASGRRSTGSWRSLIDVEDRDEQAVDEMEAGLGCSGGSRAASYDVKPVTDVDLSSS
jgi:hypothetical protein